MQINLHDAKTHLSRYVERALDGEEVVIAKAGKPLVKLVPVAEQEPRHRALGFLADEALLQLDLKGDFAAEIEAMFE